VTAVPAADLSALPADPAVRVALIERIALLERRLLGAVSARRTTDPHPDDPMRGLYLTEGHIARLADDGAAFAFPLEPWPALDDGPLAELGTRAGLEPVDLDVLVVAVAPDIDPRFERYYGYLHDDVTRRRASVGLALKLAGRDLADPAARRRLGADEPLVRTGLVTVEDADRPFLTRGLRVPDRVVAALLGDDRPDPELTGVRLDAVPITSPVVDGLARALAGGARLVYLQERPGGTGRHAAAAALAAVGKRSLLLDLDQVAPGADPFPLVRAAHREGLLIDAGVVAGPIDDLVEREPAALRALAAGRGPVVLTGAARWDPQWAPAVPLVLEPPHLTEAERARLWRVVLDGDAEQAVDPGAATAAFRMSPDQIVRAAASARLRALYAGRAVGADELQAGARSQNSAGLQRLARRIEPWAGWDQLVLPSETLQLLKELTDRVRYRERVLDQWGFRRGGGRAEGVTALFAGPSGTGKTLAAEVIAHDLGLDLYAVDLATVVDKYIGETEKNLDRIFNEAERVNSVLFFDEADALFGKRSEVKDARDRYANVEVAYLLQRMERFDGLAVLSTNLRANLDEAFARRLDVLADFPQPDEEQRLALWRHCLRSEAPIADDLDLAFCAKAFELSGGNIRNIVVTAAFLAAGDGTPVTMAHLIKAVQREYKKLGRLCLEAEFGPYYPILTGAV
jgi:hypothetical protein